MSTGETWGHAEGMTGNTQETQRDIQEAYGRHDNEETQDDVLFLPFSIFIDGS